MEKIGLNIEQLQKMIRTPLSPPPSWIRNWQLEAEHLLHLAHMAKDAGDMEQLREIDMESQKMVDNRAMKTTT